MATVINLTDSFNRHIDNYRYTDYLGAGAILGEMQPLMDRHALSTATAETAVQLYFLNITDLEMAFDMYPEVKLKLWKDCAIKIVSNLLMEHNEFQVSLGLLCIDTIVTSANAEQCYRYRDTQQ